jgi:hypothetical protein
VTAAPTGERYAHFLTLEGCPFDGGRRMLWVG